MEKTVFIFKKSVYSFLDKDLKFEIDSEKKLNEFFELCNSFLIKEIEKLKFQSDS